jgi:DNA polymerase
MIEEKLITEEAESLPPGVVKVPLVVGATRRHDGTLFVAGQGPMPADVMFISTALLEEEAEEYAESFSGIKIKSKPRYLKGPAGTMFKDCALSNGIDVDQCYYTALIKYLLPRASRLKPTKQQLAASMPCLIEEISKVKPKVIVALGKHVFDMLYPMKLKLSDIECGWFWSKRFNCRIFPMPNPVQLVLKPDYLEKFHVNFKELRRMLLSLKGVEVDTVKTNYRTIYDSNDLRSLVQQLKDGQYSVISVDCEWSGRNHVDGKLRSIQLCWAPGEAAYVRFMDAHKNYVFDISYKEAGAILGEYLNKPHVKYVGHHISADFPWMYHVLGLEYYNKCLMDTEFAQQCVDEYAGLGLERLSVQYTDCGRYDLDLMLWCKENKNSEEDGYGLVPDEIIIPYACYDVDVPFRAYPILFAELEKQELLDYYYDIFLPFVTNVFTDFALFGLPIDKKKLDDLRSLFTYVRDRLSVILQRKVKQEAEIFLVNFLNEVSNGNEEQVTDILNDLFVNDVEKAFKSAKRLAGADKVSKLLPIWNHYLEADNFNIRSGPMMRRWLFDVKGMKPVKSTGNKERGTPSIPWEKVETFPPDRQKEYTPATDKQTLTILAEQYQDDLLKLLLQLNAVGNLCKAFLKEADVDEEGNLIKENGIHYWIASDGRVHCQYSATETGRPRTWKPNCLNWPKWVNDSINAGVKRVIETDYEEGILPKEFERYRTEKIPSLRSCVAAPEGWCMVESDYQTAEIRGLAFISGDDRLIRIMTEPDPQFGFVLLKGDDKPTLVRLNYAEDCGIPKEAQIPDLIMAVVKDGKVIRKVSESELLRNGDGTLKHPKADLHWSLAEMTYEKPRELMNPDKHRSAAKVGNFSSAYGATGATLERKIEADTGIKPEKGTGDKLLKALAERQPIATSFLLSLEEAPMDPGYLRAASGRVRHFKTHPEYVSDKVSYKLKKSLHSSMGREARNFYFQESVAATAARAANKLNDYFKANNMQARVGIVLYDSVVTFCPMEERFKVAELHQRFMVDENTWTYHGREMFYPIDTDLVFAWSWKPTKEEKEKLNKRN